MRGTQKYNKIELNLIAFRQQDKNLRRFQMGNQRQARHNCSTNPRKPGSTVGSNNDCEQ